MSREVRMVPPGWEHPKGEDGQYIPLLDFDYAESVREWEQEELPQWIEGERLWREEGKVKTHSGDTMTIEEAVAATPLYRRPTETPTYQWWGGERPECPKAECYMPQWPVEQRTLYMMYEDTSEGTPISPAFETPEELARWLADTRASAFAACTATYDQWLATIRRGSAISAVIQNGVMRSGVEAMSS